MGAGKMQLLGESQGVPFSSNSPWVSINWGFPKEIRLRMKRPLVDHGGICASMKRGTLGRFLQTSVDSVVQPLKPDSNKPGSKKRVSLFEGTCWGGLKGKPKGNLKVLPFWGIGTP